MNTNQSAAVMDPENYSYKERELRRPPIEEGEVIMFDEPGRVLNHKGPCPVCCRSHYFLVTKPEFGRYTLRVRHGGGDESWPLDYHPMTIEALQMLDSDSRYRLLHVIMRAHQESAIAGYSEASQIYSKAFIEGRLKKRKRNHRITVEIKPALL